MIANMKVEEGIDEAVVALDTYNSDLNLVIDAAKYSAHPLTNEGFAFMWAGVRATHGAAKGKFCFEVKILKHIDVSHLPADEPSPNVVRVGVSVEKSSLQLGEELLSYGYGGTGKISTNCQFKDFGGQFTAGDVILCAVSCDSDQVQIGYAKNGKFLGWAFKVKNTELKGQALFPHILTKNCSFNVNFGQQEKPYFELPNELKEFVFIGCLPLEQRIGGTRPPKERKDCEMIMMCGLPGAGKSVWAAEYSAKHPDKKYNVLGTNNIIDKMKVMGLPRKRNYAGRWDVLIQMATKCLNKMFEIGSKLRRNYILDQTNVYPTAQRRKMRNFEGFKRTAVVVVPTEEEFRRRCDKRDREEGKEVPENAVLEMKANFKLPEVGDVFDDVIFTELQLEEAEKLVKKYNEEGRNALGPSKKMFKPNDPGSNRGFDAARGSFVSNRGSRDGFDGSRRGGGSFGGNHGFEGVKDEFKPGFDREHGGFGGRGGGGRGGFNGGRGGFDGRRGGFDGGRGGFDGGRGGFGGGRGGFDGGRGGFDGGRGGFNGGGRGGYDDGRGNFNGGQGGFDGGYDGRGGRGGFDGGRGGRGSFDGGRGGRGSFDGGRGGRGGFDGGRGGFDVGRGGRGSFDGGRGGRGSFDGGRGGRGGFESGRGGRGGFDGGPGGRGGFDDGLGGRGGFDGGPGGRGGFGGRGGRGGFDGPGGRGSFDGPGGRGSFDGPGGRGSFDGPGGRGGFDGPGGRGGFDGPGGRGGFDGPGGRGGFDGGPGGRGGFDGGQGRRGSFDGGRGGRGGRSSFDGGRGDNDEDKAVYDGGRGGFGGGRGSRGRGGNSRDSFDSGRGGRGGFGSNRGSFDSGSENSGGFDRKRRYDDGPGSNSGGYGSYDSNSYADSFNTQGNFDRDSRGQRPSSQSNYGGRDFSSDNQDRYPDSRKDLSGSRNQSSSLGGNFGSRDDSNSSSSNMNSRSYSTSDYGRNSSGQYDGGYSSYGNYSDKPERSSESFPSRDTFPAGTYKKESDQNTGSSTLDSSSRSTRAAVRPSGRTSTRWGAETTQSQTQATTTSTADSQSYSSYGSSVKTEPVASSGQSQYAYSTYAQSNTPVQGYQAPTYGYQQQLTSTMAAPQAWTAQPPPPPPPVNPTSQVTPDQTQWAQYYQQAQATPQYYSQYYGQAAAAAATNVYTPAYGTK